MPAVAQDDLLDVLRDALRAELAPQLQALHRFVDRRFAELSAELHASVSLAEASEGNLTAQLAAIHGEIAGLLAPPAAATRNSGSELETVVQATEAAAERILEAAEAIALWAAGDRHDPAALNARVNAIFEACSFQDLTGQRLRRAIEHLQGVEAMLDRMVPAPGDPRAGTVPPDLAQTEVDRLLRG